MWRSTFILGCISIALPWPALAALSINEVAWMGDTVSANHEWIELYNSGSAAVAVDGWVLSDGMNLTIPLTGTVGASSYAVLERTSEASAPEQAFLVYSGALVNTGATLVLKDGTGAIVDQVAGGENWQGIGGDNTSKETAQYTTAGWITAVATPGAANATVGTETPVVTKTESGNSSGKLLSPEARPDITLSRAPKEAIELTLTLPPYVNELVSFTVEAAGVGEQFKSSLQYSWNFGDATAERGKTVTHAYQYPGTYVVRARAEYAERSGFQDQTVTVLPVTLSLSRNNAGDIQIHNDAVYAVDLSRYRLVGEGSFLIPKDTVMLPRGTITIPFVEIEERPLGSLVMLYDASGAAVAMAAPALSAVPVAVREETKQPLLMGTSYTPRVLAPTPLAATLPVVSTTTPVVVEETQATTVIPIEGNATPVQGTYLWLIALLTITVAAIWFKPRSPAEPTS
jgi:Lamin Tail Domain/PKD domain